MRQTRKLTVIGCLLLASAYACGDHDVTAPDLVPAALDIISGQEQSGQVGQELPQPLIVRVVNASGDPLPGQIVNFHVVKGDGSVFAGASITNEDGKAQERWTLGKSVADSQVVEARAVDASTGAALVFARFIATAIPGPPMTLVKVAGDQQVARAGSTLPDSLRVQAKDAFGNPIPNATVTWTAASGAGTLGRASSTTNADGYASNSWTLGADAGTDSVSAAVAADLATAFEATAVATGTVTIAKRAGDAQTATPGTAVAIKPSVTVTDGFGPRAGVPVTFTVTSGGGSVTGANAVTDADGIATVGSWVLGSTLGANTLTATIPSGAAVTFSASAMQVSPGISVSIKDPAGPFVGDTVFVRVAVASQQTVSSVRAVLAGTTVNLVQLGDWTGRLPIVGAPQDTMTLVVTATDVNGNSSQALRALIHDHPPNITVSAPADSSVARPAIQVDAACTDDDGSGCSLSVRREDGMLLAGPTPSAIHASVSLAAFDGGNVDVLILAEDSRGLTSVIRRNVWVESSPRLQLLGTAEGVVKDVSGARLLWSYGSIVGVRQIGGTDETITSALHGTLQRSYLTPSGAVFSADASTAPYSQLYVWRNGTLTTKAVSSTTSLSASGNYAIYTTPPNGFGPLYRLDVVTGTEVLVSSNAGNTENDVSENGDVVYWTASYDIQRYRASTSTPITSDDDMARWNTYPVTDGINVVFRRHPPCCAPFSTQPTEIWIFDGTSLSMLAPAAHRELWPRRHYAVNGGWTAFAKDDASGDAQIWTRSPTGMLRTVSAVGASSTIAAFGSDGAVVFDNPNGRYLAGPSSAPTRIASTNGTVVWDEDHFVMILGNSAFAISP